MISWEDGELWSRTQPFESFEQGLGKACWSGKSWKPAMGTWPRWVWSESVSNRYGIYEQSGVACKSPVMPNLTLRVSPTVQLRQFEVSQNNTYRFRFGECLALRSRRSRKHDDVSLTCDFLNTTQSQTATYWHIQNWPNIFCSQVQPRYCWLRLIYWI